MALRRPLVALAVVALLVASAGCSAFDDGPDRDREPYGVDDPFGSGPPPGLTEDGVTDRTALASAHYDALEGESFRAAYRNAQYDENGSTVFDEETRLTVTDDARSAWSTRTERDPDTVDEESERFVTLHAWTDGDESYTRIENRSYRSNRSGGVAYFRDAQYASAEPALPVSILDLYGETDSVAVDRTDGTERYRLEGTGTVGTVENASFELLLSEEGYVESYYVRGIQSIDGERLSVEYSGEFIRSDDLELSAPAWLEEARAEFEGA